MNPAIQTSDPLWIRAIAAQQRNTLLDNDYQPVPD